MERADRLQAELAELHSTGGRVAAVATSEAGKDVSYCMLASATP